MGGDDEVDRVAVEAGGGERREQARQRVIGAGVDEGGAATFDDEVRGVEQRPVKAGVDDTDAVRQRFDEIGRCRRGGGRVGHEGAFRRASTIFEADSRERVRVEDNADDSEFDAANGDEVMNAIDRCARRVAVFLLVAAGLSGLRHDGTGRIAPGDADRHGTPVADRAER